MENDHDLRDLRRAVSLLGDRMTRLEAREEGPSGNAALFAAVDGLRDRMGGVELKQDETSRILKEMRAQQETDTRALQAQLDTIESRTMNTRQLVAYLSGALVGGGALGGSIGAGIMRIFGG